MRSPKSTFQQILMLLPLGEGPADKIHVDDYSSVCVGTKGRFLRQNSIELRVALSSSGTILVSVK